MKAQLHPGAQYRLAEPTTIAEGLQSWTVPYGDRIIVNGQIHRDIATWDSAFEFTKDGQKYTISPEHVTAVSDWTPVSKSW